MFIDHSSKHLFKDFNQGLNETLRHLNKSSKETVIMGDLKSDYMKRNDNREVKDIFTHNGYKQLLKSPTRVTRMSATLVNVIPTNITLHYITIKITM